MGSLWQGSGYEKLLWGLIFIVGVVNLLPFAGAFSDAKLMKAYGIGQGSEAMVMLLRHRASLFGLMGGFVLSSLLVTHWRLPALVLAGLSMLIFVVLVCAGGETSAEIERIALVDVTVLPMVVIALGMLLRQPG